MKNISSWKNHIACPECGASVYVTKEVGKECPACGRVFTMSSGNILDWGRRSRQKIRRPSVTGRLKSVLSPLSSPFLPFRHLSRLRVERYYYRTLTDFALARKWGDHYLEGLDLQPHATVLDFGCGRGRNVGILRQLGFDVAGQDVDTNGWWKRLPEAGFQSADGFDRLPWQDASFDLVLEVGVIHYLNEQQLVNNVREVHRVLKPGGCWLLLEANDKSVGAHSFQFPSGRLHSLPHMQVLCKDQGFEEIDLSYEGYYASIFPIAVNYIRKQLSPCSLDFSDFDSWLAARLSPELRGLWRLRLRKSREL